MPTPGYGSLFFLSLLGCLAQPVSVIPRWESKPQQKKNPLWTHSDTKHKRQTSSNTKTQKGHLQLKNYPLANTKKTTKTTL